MSRRAALLSLVAAAAAWSCSGDSPAGPTPVAGVATRASLTTTTGGTAHASNVPPQVEFRTTPEADAQGRISVTVPPYEVKFNMCHLTDPDEGDDFHFSYDYEGTGNFEQGICRTSHLYAADQCVTATVCATDQQPDHKVCKSYDVCTAGGGGGGTGGGGALVTRLQFWVWNGASSGNGTDSMQAAIDGASVFALVTGDPAFTAGYAQVTVDVSAYADGAAHQLSFSSSSTGPSNFSLDDVSIRCRSGANKVMDPGFEAGANFNPAWTQMSTTFGSPICSQATCGDGGGTAKAHAGSWWVWFGGTSGAESASVVQGSITIPVCQ